ncbi:MAG: hypothetical protein ACI88A_005220 [Paraglaciecola sp.]|jgi:hypothetical protein
MQAQAVRPSQTKLADFTQKLTNVAVDALLNRELDGHVD